MKQFISEHSTELLVGLGLASMVSGSALIVPATFKVNDKIVIETERIGRRLTRREVIKISWKDYILPASMILAGGSMIVMSNRIGAKRYAAISSAYTVAAATADRYKDRLLKSVEPTRIVDNAVNNTISETVNQQEPINTVQEKYLPEKQQVSVRSSDTVLFCESICGATFESTVNNVDAAVNEFNRILTENSTATVNDWYHALGLPTNKAGDLIGWHIFVDLMRISYAGGVTDDMRPCLIIEYDVLPKPLNSLY